MTTPYRTSRVIPDTDDSPQVRRVASMAENAIQELYEVIVNLEARVAELEAAP